MTINFSDRRMFRILFICLSLLPLVCSCVKEDRDDCKFPLRLKFSYLYNREGRDLLRDEVEAITLFLYDTESGNFVAQTRVNVSDLDNGNAMTWNVAPGRYSLVAWGGILSRYEAIPGTHISGMSAGLPENIAGHPHRQEHLWHNLSTDILVNGDVSPVYDVDLHKLSNDLVINVTSDSPLSSRTSAMVSAGNGRYNAYSANISNAPAVYEPLTVMASPYEESHTFTLLRLAPDDDSHLMLSLDGNDTPLYDDSLSSLLARLPDADLDLDDEFFLNFHISDQGSGNFSIALAVNGWEIVDYNVSLNNP